MKLITIEQLLEEIKERQKKANIRLIQRAYDFAKKAHDKQKRKTGEEYIFHGLAAAHNLLLWGMDDKSMAAGILHDVIEDTPVTAAEIRKNFGQEITRLVEGVSKLTLIKYRGVDRYAENLRRMCMAMAKDIRVMIIKCADRVHNLSTLYALPPEKQKRIALESIEIYAAIANRLGMGEIKGQLEDLAFPYILSEEYEWLVKKIKKPYEEKLEYLNKVRTKLERILKESKIHFLSVHGRGKHLYSLYKKVLEHNRDIAKIYDLVAMRVIVENVADCYTTLGIIHEYWRPLKGRIKDYIAQPKPNGYRSIHTTVFCDQGEIVEFQIRTQEMHEEAEYGVAAHWHYSELRRSKKVPTKKYLPWIKQIKKIHREMKDENQFLESLKVDVFKNRIFVFTPKGDVIELPEGSTVIDFAYAIHTDIGNKCCGAKINEKIADLKTPLKSGDVVKIFTDKNRPGPNSDWIKFVVTSTARSAIKNWLKKQKEKEKEKT